jgi:metallo-beta-lactamase family protein
VYVDSPLSNRLTNLHRRYAAILDSQVQAEHLVDKDVFGFAGLHYVSTQQESMDLNGRRGPMIIIAASGMCESGRVLHHLKHAIEDPETTVLIIGFQAQNTLGRRIVERAPYVRIFDRQYALRAQVETLNGFSGHADAHDFRWWFDHLGSTTGVGQAFIVHGEQEGASAVQAMLRDVCDEEPVIAEPGRTYEIGKL